MKGIAAILALTIATGCLSLDHEHARIMAAANRCAKHILREANKHPVYPDDPPFQLSQFTNWTTTHPASVYDLHPSRTNVWVYYENRNPTYTGHPNWFVVIVDPITLKTEWMGGE